MTHNPQSSHYGSLFHPTAIVYKLLSSNENHRNQFTKTSHMASFLATMFFLGLIVVGEACDVIKSGVSEQQKQEIVNLHNKLRQNLASGKEPGQPPAANMKKLTWDDDLAATAQNLANECLYQHDAYIERKTGRYKRPGQNLAFMQTVYPQETYNFTLGLQIWYNEVIKCNFDPAAVDYHQFSTCDGHYTQFAWAETEAIGCGYVVHPLDSTFHHIIVCNYGPGGNRIGDIMYQKGSACSQCSNGCSSDYSALCTGTGFNQSISQASQPNEKTFGDQVSLPQSSHGVPTYTHTQHTQKKSDQTEKVSTFRLPHPHLPNTYVSHSVSSQHRNEWETKTSSHSHTITGTGAGFPGVFPQHPFNTQPQQ